VSRACDAVACEGVAVMVSYDYSAGAKCPLPESVRRAVAEIEVHAQ
jgi:acyl-CoA thioesterase FadM